MLKLFLHVFNEWKYKYSRHGSKFTAYFVINSKTSLSNKRKLKAKFQISSRLVKSLNLGIPLGLQKSGSAISCFLQLGLSCDPNLSVWPVSRNEILETISHKSVTFATCQYKIDQIKLTSRKVSAPLYSTEHARSAWT